MNESKRFGLMMAICLAAVAVVAAVKTAENWDAHTIEVNMMACTFCGFALFAAGMALWLANED